ncbi:MAG TPA: polysaccharide deacetylase family protein [Firmicutes bacterium]|nr:polysaccharide deacetylase family protein [Bacillota bacterium]
MVGHKARITSLQAFWLFLVGVVLALAWPGAAYSAHVEGPIVRPRPEFMSRVDYPVGVLMYHVIGEGPNDLYVDEKKFAWQMEYLARNGYRSITATQYAEALKKKKNLPRRSIIITFDDGYADLYSRAFPVMKKHGFIGVAFVCSSTVGTRGHVTWEQLKEMEASGWEIGCHTATHPDLTKLEDERLHAEIRGSKAEIERRLGIKVQSFCYPSGRYNSRVVRAVREAGFSMAFTVNPQWIGPAHGAFELPRLRVNGSDSGDRFVKMVSSSPPPKRERLCWW